MTQFMLCLSPIDLRSREQRLLSAHGECWTTDIKNSDLFVAVADCCFDRHDMKDVWVIRKIDEATAAPSRHEDFIRQSLVQLYEASEMMVLWYGNEYTDLDRIETKDDLVDFLRNLQIDNALELYILCRNKERAVPFATCNFPQPST
ncbi:MAG: hypothetical protein FWD68_14365 [Alphaproteobacteria bacterium]|nr:hypothetical protein [Alphaproteobacteria bacterium]